MSKKHDEIDQRTQEPDEFNQAPAEEVAPKAKTTKAAKAAKEEPAVALQTLFAKPSTTDEIDPKSIIYPTDPEHEAYDERAFEPPKMRLVTSIMENTQIERIKVYHDFDEPSVLRPLDGRGRKNAIDAINEGRAATGGKPIKARVEIVYPKDKNAVAILLHVFNEDRYERDALGKAEAMVRLLEKKRATQQQIADIFHVNAKTVQRAKKLLKDGSDELKAALKEGTITLVKALDLCRFPKEEQPARLERYKSGKDALEQDEYSSGGDDEKEGGGEGGKKKAKKAKMKNWVKDLAPFVKDLKRNTFDDSKRAYTAQDMRNMAVGAINFCNADKNETDFVALMEAIGFQMTEEEGAEEPKKKGKKGKKAELDPAPAHATLPPRSARRDGNPSAAQPRHAVVPRGTERRHDVHCR